MNGFEIVLRVLATFYLLTSIMILLNLAFIKFNLKVLFYIPISLIGIYYMSIPCETIFQFIYGLVIAAIVLKLLNNAAEFLN